MKSGECKLIFVLDLDSVPMETSYLASGLMKSSTVPTCGANDPS